MTLSVITCHPDVYLDETQRPSSTFWPAQEESDSLRKFARTLKVIIVDDEPAIAETLADILEGQGCQAIAVSGGAAAVDLAQKLHPHLVISDVSMPGMNGIETAISIRRICPDCRVILFSGHGSTADLLKDARAAGHDFELLSKPIKPDALLKVLGLWKPNQ
jgi:CheY-like chemotaxis protein